MTKELYKRFRPKTLAKVVGNSETVGALTKALEEESVPHTILFSGPSGCGKTTLARILADALECHEMDLREMDCSAFRGIDTIRDIMRAMRLAPTGGKVRVWILDEVHQLSKDAQHGALKMLEDTPRHVYFFLCTTDPQKLLPTIRNRCTEHPVRPLDRKELEGLIRRTMERAKFSVPDESVQEVIDHAQGSARASLVLLDKIRLLPPEQHSEALKGAKDETEAEAIELCRALIKKESWSKVAALLKTIKGEPESIRHCVLGYARSCLLGGSNHQAYSIICAFENHFYDSKAAGLARACFEAIHGGD